MSSYALLFLNTLGTHFALQHPMITDVERDLKKNLLNTILKLFLKSFTTDKVFAPCVENDSNHKNLFLRYWLLYINIASNGA